MEGNCLNYDKTKGNYNRNAFEEIRSCKLEFLNVLQHFLDIYCA